MKKEVLTSKVEVKSEPVKAEPVKAVESVKVLKVETKETVEKKAPVNKAATKTTAKTTKTAAQEKTTKKASAAKTTKTATKTTKAAKDEMNAQVYIQTSYCEIVAKDVIEKSIEAYKNEGNKSKINDINVYIKPEENAAYYVINEKIAGRVDIF